MKQTKQQLIGSINIILSMNEKLLDQKGIMTLVKEETESFACVSAKPNEDDFIPAIINAINEELDANCTIVKAVQHNYGYGIEIITEMTRDGETWKQTFYGNFCTLH